MARKLRRLRFLVTPLLILVWIALAGIGGPYFGKVSEVSSNDQASFLPTSSESAKVQDLQAEFQDSKTIPALVVLERAEGIRDTDRAFGATLQKEITSVSEDIVGASPAIPSEDGKALESIVLIKTDSEVRPVTEAVRAWVAEHKTDGLTAYVTGPAGFFADLGEAFGGIDGILLGVALLAVFVILLVVYRSPLLPVIVLFTSMVALSAAIFVVWWLAKWDIVQLSGQVQGILFILVIGAATDYSLLYVSRFREALRLQKNKLDATIQAVKRSIEPIAASAGTVIAGLLCLLLSDLGSSRALGPVASIGIVLSVLAALTFLPAVLYAFGRATFWPFRPQYDPRHAKAEAPLKAKGLWPKVAAFVDRSYRPIWIVSALVLIVVALASVQLKANGVEQSQLILGASEARDGQAVLSEHYPGGSGAPTLVVTTKQSASVVASALLGTEGIDAVTGTTDRLPSGAVPYTDHAGFNNIPLKTLERKEGDDSTEYVLLQVTLAMAPDSDEAEALIPTLREKLTSIDDKTLVGGTTAVTYDSNQSSIRDRTVIIPIVLVVITIILMLLLRSLVAPLLLLATTVLSFAATLGIAALVFNHLLGFPGADPSVPLYGFIFLVALGIDYNIFLMTRVREETVTHGTRYGVLRGLAVTGSVITSAGVVLAATFSALAVIPILFLVQIAFIVAFGVLLDTIVIRSLLVPALIRDIDRASWWPSRLAKLKISKK